VLHAHLGEQHPDAVRFEDRGEKWFYALDCPICGDGYERQIKPRGRDPGFVDEYSAQIRLVAFDMLVNHLLVEHDPEAAATAGEAGGTVTTEPGPVPTGPAAGPAWLVEARRKAAEAGPESGT